MRIDSVGSKPINVDFGEMLKNLEVGDAVKGRVLEAANGSVTIKTAGGQAFTAALLAEVQLHKGEFVELLINNIADGKVFAQIKEDEAQAPDVNTKLSGLLAKLNIPANSKNIEAAKLLIKYNLPLDKETLTSAVNLQKSLSSLGQGKGDGLVGLLLSGMDVKNTPVDVLNKIVLTSETEVKKLLNDIEKSENTTTAVADEDEKSAAVSINSLAIKGKEAPADELENKLLNVLKSVVKELDGEKQTPVQRNILPDNKEGNDKQQLQHHEVSVETQTGIAAVSKDRSMQLEAKVREIMGKLGIELNSDAGKLLSSIADTVASVDKKSLEQIVFLLSKDIEVTPKNLDVLANNISNTKKVSEFLDKLQQQVDKYDRQDLKDIKESISKLFMKPEQLEDKAAVKEHIKEALKLGEKLENALMKGGINDTDIKSTLSNLKDNIDFIKNINDYSNYLQIPVMINERTTTTDVYVFREGKKGKKIDPNNATILIALDLKYLGHLESMVNVNNKSVNVTFRLEDKSIGALINGKVEELRQSLEARGYNLNPVKVIELEQSFNLLSLDKLINEGNKDKLHFDAKI